jgi:predicted Zn-dependent protease
LFAYSDRCSNFKMKLFYTLCLITLWANVFAQPEEIIYTWYTQKDSVYIMRARQLYDSEDYEGTLKALKKLSRPASKEPGTFLLKGMALLETGQCNAAIAAFTKGLEINPHLIEFYACRAEAQVELKNFSAAATDYATYVYYFPEDVATAIAVAQCLLEANQTGNAINYLKKYEKKDTTVVNALALLYIEQQDYLKAINTLLPWQKKYSEYAEGHETLSIAYSELEYYDEALLAIERVIALKPNYAYGYYLKGYYLESIEEDDEAKRFYAIAKSLGFETE